MIHDHRLGQVGQIVYERLRGSRLVGCSLRARRKRHVLDQIAGQVLLVHAVSFASAQMIVEESLQVGLTLLLPRRLSIRTVC